MSREQVLRERLRRQRLVAPDPGEALDVVRLLTCVQSQECAHAFWSLGMRTRGLSYADVQREFDEGRFVRTHLLRPTWHFVAAEELRWVLAVTSARVQQINRSRYRQLQLDQDLLDRGSALILDALASADLTRAELGTALREGGISVEDGRLAHLVMNAELEGLICSGPMRGAQHTYAVVADRVPPGPGLSGDDGLRELTFRFFSGHGPAGVKDFTRWSSLTTTTAQHGLELVGDRLEQVTADGQLLWRDPSAVTPAEVADEPAVALLLPLYDEATLSYPQLNFPTTEGHPHVPGTDLFVGTVVVDAVNVGLWRRTVRGRSVQVETQLAPGTSQRVRAAVAEAVERLAKFLDRRLEPAEPAP